MKTWAITFVVLGWLSQATSGFCCLNGKNESPPPPQSEDIVKTLTQRVDRAHWEKMMQYLTETPPAPSDWIALNEKAVVLVHLGHHQQAFQILQNVEKRHPGHYRTAANLGTAYELLGKNEEALRWIKEGIKRNPKSHQGSEWLHVRILEAKIALQKDKDWLKTHSVTGLEFGTADSPDFPSSYPRGNQGQVLEAGHVESALKYQLHERLEFIAPPEEVVSDLLFDLANLHALFHDPQAARPVYEMAWKYGPARPELVKSRLESAGGTAGLPLWIKLLFVGGASALLVMGLSRSKKAR
ncbi:MAG TPA: tetratricopeptide repeat protein [Abditibacteriaceae bacterium]